MIMVFIAIRLLLEVIPDILQQRVDFYKCQYYFYNYFENSDTQLTKAL